MSGAVTSEIDSTTGKPRRGRVKCVAWDLDNTVWHGVLLEGDEVRLRADVVDVIRRLDQVGILNSIVSKNDPEAALAQLRAFGIDDLFLHPKISWNAKSHSVREIAESLNIGLDSIAFVDDQEFEREEVAHALPQVMCVDVAELATVVGQPEFNPRFVTGESKRRREMYRHQIARDDAEREFVGTNEQFLAGLGMVLTIADARREDLQRAEELTIRTNQLNSTGRTYSYEELDTLRRSPDHLLLTVSLVDRFGGYGTVGLTLVEKGTDSWTLRLLVMSCRVVSRGVGTVLLNHVMTLARQAGVRLVADLVDTGRNRMMQIAYAFAGFREIGRDGNHLTLECDLSRIQPCPSYVELVVGPAAVADEPGAS